MIKKILYYLRIYGPGMFIWHFSWELRMRLRWILLKSFSQGDEDIIIDNLLGRNEKGFYVDVGAYDPMRFNNTERFYIRGWKGISIEPDPIKINKFNKLRPRDINLNVGVANKNGELIFFRFDPQTLSTFSKKAAKSNQKLGFNLTEKVKIKVYKLRKILEENYLGKQIDFFSIDTEGYDIEVLKRNNWKKFKPKVICIEEQDYKIEKFLSKLGYKKVSQTEVNSIFLYSS